MPYNYYILPVSFSKTSERLSSLIKRNHVFISLELDSKVQAKEDILKRERQTIAEFIVDETLLKRQAIIIMLGYGLVAIEPLNKVILGICISFEKKEILC